MDFSQINEHDEPFSLSLILFGRRKNFVAEGKPQDERTSLRYRHSERERKDEREKLKDK